MVAAWQLAFLRTVLIYLPKQHAKTISKTALLALRAANYCTHGIGTLSDTMETNSL